MCVLCFVLCCAVLCRRMLVLVLVCIECLLLVCVGVVCGVWRGFARGRKKNVCTFKTPPCVPAKRPHVDQMRAFCWQTRRRFERAHGMRGLSPLSLALSSLSLCLSFSLFLFFPSSFFSCSCSSRFFFSCQASFTTYWVCTCVCTSTSSSTSTNVARSVIANKSISAHAAAAVRDDRGYLLFGHCWKCEQTANKVSTKSAFEDV